MGQWVAIVVGQGSHDNADFEGDADRIAQQFVAKLKDAGHRIFEASFVVIEGDGKRRSLEE
jgi:hypothetical protein